MWKPQHDLHVWHSTAPQENFFFLLCLSLCVFPFDTSRKGRRKIRHKVAWCGEKNCSHGNEKFCVCICVTRWIEREIFTRAFALITFFFSKGLKRNFLRLYLFKESEVRGWRTTWIFLWYVTHVYWLWNQMEIEQVIQAKGLLVLISVRGWFTRMGG